MISSNSPMRLLLKKTTGHLVVYGGMRLCQQLSQKLSLIIRLLLSHIINYLIIMFALSHKVIIVLLGHSSPSWKCCCCSSALALGYTFGLACQDDKPLITIPFKYPSCLSLASSAPIHNSDD
ncbi:unnamed protein product [Lupinus luteus]|uniref:Uncharacterized protein n=1 Tax=Lupinus luteus TaxID=3873 RepID=A0AAV1VQN3_LUPLU